MDEPIKLKAIKANTARGFLLEAAENETIKECILICKTEDEDGVFTEVWYTTSENRITNMGRCFAAAMCLWHNK